MFRGEQKINTKQIIDKILIISKNFADTVNKEKIFVYAAQTSYFVLMSTVPFMMIATMTIGRIFPMSSEQIAAVLSDLLPGMFKTFAQNLLEQIFVETGGLTFSLTTVLLLVAASAGVRSLGAGIRYIYVKEAKLPFLKDLFRSFSITLLFIFTMLLAVLILVLGDPINLLLQQFNYIPKSNLFTVIINYKNIIFVLTLTVIFMTAYKGLSISHIPLKHHLPGALISAGGWVLFSFGFNVYITTFSNYPSLYGGFAIIIVFMIWLNMCMAILLFGALFNKMLYNNKK